jgi:hypothetical protein
MTPIRDIEGVGPILRELFRRSGYEYAQHLMAFDGDDRRLQETIDVMKLELGSLRERGYWLRLGTRAVNVIERIKSRTALGADPEQFLCAWSYELMKNPYVLPSGHSCEKEVIMEIIKDKGINPLTAEKEKLTIDQIYPNNHLRLAIEYYKRNHKSYGVMC